MRILIKTGFEGACSILSLKLKNNDEKEQYDGSNAIAFISVQIRAVSMGCREMKLPAPMHAINLIL